MAIEEANQDVKEVVETPEATEAESSPEETNDQEDELLNHLTSDEDESSEETEEVEAEEQSEEAEDTEESEDTEAEEAEVVQDTDGEEADATEEPKSKAEQRKEQLNGEIRDLVSEKNQLKDEIEKLNTQVYQPQTAEELEEEGYSPEEARVRALEQKLELKDYNERVVSAQVGLAQEAQRIEREFPIFNPDSPEYDQDVASQAAELLQASLDYDPNTGQVIGSRSSPYKLYKTLAGAYQKSNVSGQVKGQKEAVRRMAKADTPTSAPVKETKKDPILEALASDD